MRESKIEAYLVKQAKAAGGDVRKVKWIGRRGAPDRLLMLAGRRLTDGLDCAWCNPRGLGIWVELKATGVAPEPHQLREHERMRKLGQTVVVIDSFEAVDELIGANRV